MKIQLNANRGGRFDLIRKGRKNTNFILRMKTGSSVNKKKKEKQIKKNKDLHVFLF